MNDPFFWQLNSLAFGIFYLLFLSLYWNATTDGKVAIAASGMSIGILIVVNLVAYALVKVV